MIVSCNVDLPKLGRAQFFPCTNPYKRDPTPSRAPLQAGTRGGSAPSASATLRHEGIEALLAGKTVIAFSEGSVNSSREHYELQRDFGMSPYELT